MPGTCERVERRRTHAGNCKFVAAPLLLLPVEAERAEHQCLGRCSTSSVLLQSGVGERARSEPQSEATPSCRRALQPTQ
jgi:hypothetical protein